MKKILTCLLLLANLSSGLAFAWDSHPEAVVGHGSADINLLADSDYDYPDGGLNHNGHCCHSGAHLVDLIFDHATPFVASSDDAFIVLTQAPVFLYIAPLLRPPIA